MPDPIDDLFTLPLRDFTSARDALAAKLAAARQRDRAREVRALRRPTVAAWVVNQLAHRSGVALRRLIDAGDTLRRAQRRVVRGGGADELRAATKRRQDTLRDLRDVAASILRDAGAASHLDEVLATLEAASVDPAAAKVVAAGRLSKEIARPAGFGDATPMTLVANEKPAARKSAAAAGPKQPLVREHTADAKRFDGDATRSEQAAVRASRRRAALERAMRAHQREVDRLRERLQASERRLRDAETELARAVADESRATEHAGDLRRAARAARAKADAER